MRRCIASLTTTTSGTLTAATAATTRGRFLSSSHALLMPDGLDSLIAELQGVNTSGDTSKPSRKKSAKKPNTNVLTSSERLQQALHRCDDLTAQSEKLKEQKAINIEKLNTGSDRQGVTMGSAQLPLSSQETRMEGAPQEFKPSPVQLVSTTAPMKGTVAFTTVIGRVSGEPQYLQDENGAYTELMLSYVVPVGEGVEAMVEVRCYHTPFLQYCKANIKDTTLVQISGWLMPVAVGDAKTSPATSFVVACTPSGGNVAVLSTTPTPSS